jgi:hypothetical protein
MERADGARGRASREAGGDYHGRAALRKAGLT